MQAETKKLGILLIEAGLITAAQLQEALRQQRVTGDRLGSALVSHGIINEDSLMDFLAKQTGVPRLDVKNLEIPHAVLQRIPRRMAEQLTILPVSFKEPKSLVLAMADPMDLNALDSARFASGLNIEPMVAGHTALRLAISEHYARLGAPGSSPHPLPVEPAAAQAESLAVPFQLSLTPYEPPPPAHGGARDYPRDPFFPDAPQEEVSPFNFFSGQEPEAASAPEQPPIIHQRSALAEKVRPLENFGTRALVLGTIRLLQRRGILGNDELQRLLVNLAEAGEIDPDK